MLQNGVLLVDVREHSEVEACAYSSPAKIHLPYSELKARFAELPTDQALLFACHSGKRSLRAAAYLSYKGYTRVANLEGGLVAWLAAGLPVQGKRCNCSLTD
ncbi:MAG: rhodanese-like domain-containing protein [Lewinellaceae bacterium]|nr:rhodanese-like domain-containing protein [Lewinellaceae bacterium]